MSTEFEKKFEVGVENEGSTDEESVYAAHIDEVAEEAKLLADSLDGSFDDALAATDVRSYSGEEAHVTSPESVMPRNSRMSSFMPAAMIHGHPWKWMALAFGLGALVGAGVVFMVMSLRAPEKVVVEKVVHKTKVVYRDAPLGAQEGGGETELAETVGEDATLAGLSKGKSRRNKKVGDTAEDRKQRLLAQLNTEGTTAAEAPSGAGLTQQQTSAVVAKNQSSLQICYERELKKGTAPEFRDLKVLFNVNVGKSGTVTNVTMRGDGTQVGGLKKCLNGAVRSWMFPPSDAASSVQFPIVFTPSR